MEGSVTGNGAAAETGVGVLPSSVAMTLWGVKTVETSVARIVRELGGVADVQAGHAQRGEIGRPGLGLVERHRQVGGASRQVALDLVHDALDHGGQRIKVSHAVDLGRFLAAQHVVHQRQRVGIRRGDVGDTGQGHADGTVVGRRGVGGGGIGRVVGVGRQADRGGGLVRLGQHGAPGVELGLQRGRGVDVGEVLTIDSGWAKPVTAGWRRPALREVQIGPRIMPGIGFVIRGSIADKAGLEADDLIVAVNGKPTFNLEEIVVAPQEGLAAKLSAQFL